MNQLRELSLFSGYGGLSLGLRLANLNVRTVAYVEWSKYPQEILKARIRDGFLDDAPIWGDISTFRGEQFRGLVDILSAGFPCQPHSVAGLQRGADDDRNKWPDTLRVIHEVGPRYVILENVPGLLSASSNGGTPAYGGTVVGELASLGYSVHWRTLGADDVGAPHRRKRWFCIGVLANSSIEGLEGRYRDDKDEGWPVREGIGHDRDGVGSESGRSGGQLADSDRGRFEQRQPEAEPQTWLGEQGERNDTELGNSDSHAIQGMEQGTQQGEHQRQVGLPNRTPKLFALPVWPPRPDDIEGWVAVLNERPDLAPALTKDALATICGVADGATRRVDRLKALGNGVVPAVETAFLIDLMKGRKTHGN